MHLTAITPNVMLPNVMLSAIRSEAENEVEACGGFFKSLHWVRITNITEHTEHYAVLLIWFDYASLRSAALPVTSYPPSSRAQPRHSRGEVEGPVRLHPRENRKSWMNRALRHPWPRCHGAIWFDYTPLRCVALTMTGRALTMTGGVYSLTGREGNS
jgi:hypothetical protein